MDSILIIDKIATKHLALSQFDRHQSEQSNFLLEFGLGPRFVLIKVE